MKTTIITTAKIIRYTESIVTYDLAFAAKYLDHCDPELADCIREIIDDPNCVPTYNGAGVTVVEDGNRFNIIYKTDQPVKDEVRLAKYVWSDEDNMYVLDGLSGNAQLDLFDELIPRFNFDKYSKRD